jgi:hydrogenase-4 component F
VETLLLLGVIGPPLLAAALALVPGRLSWAVRANAITMPIAMATASVMAWQQAMGNAPLVLGSLWRVDALSVRGRLGSEPGHGSPRPPARVRIYVNLFTATMLMALCTNNLGVMWVAIEASTVASALLIPLGRKRSAIDASWKYLLIGSVGIALAFTGTVLAFVDFASTGRSVEAALNWPTLMAAAPSLHPEVARLAFIFLIVGFGTKAGLAPMHTWLPDAHAEAPAPLSALMSGVMLAVALYAIMRWKAVTDAALGSVSRHAPGAGWCGSILIGAISLVARYFKHLLLFEHRAISWMLRPRAGAGGRSPAPGWARFAKSTAFAVGSRVGIADAPDRGHFRTGERASGDRRAVRRRHSRAGRPSAVQSVRVRSAPHPGRLAGRSSCPHRHRPHPDARRVRRAGAPPASDALRRAQQ